MKPPVSSEIRLQVLNLRRSNSLQEVADRTGLPIGTVKTICSRSGAFRDNQKQRALFSLPPIRESSQTLPAVQHLPPQKSVTGDSEIDSVLWLREVIGTGQAAMIEKAMEAVKLVKTPLDELEKRYTNHLVSMNPGHFAASFASFGFGDLEGLAKKSVKKLTLRNEAAARFGDSLFDDTEAERFCIETLAGLETDRYGSLDDGDVAKRFKARPELMPNTLSDCLTERAFWRDLYALRKSTGDYGDPGKEAYARECFAFRCLAEIRPRSKEESVAVFRYLAENDHMNQPETNDILLNLIG